MVLHLLLNRLFGSQTRLLEQFLSSIEVEPNDPRDIVYFIVMHLLLNGSQVIFSALLISHLDPPESSAWLVHA